jgi:hypothetical protein
VPILRKSAVPGVLEVGLISAVVSMQPLHITHRNNSCWNAFQILYSIPCSVMQLFEVCKNKREILEKVFWSEKRWNARVKTLYYARYHVVVDNINLSIPMTKKFEFEVQTSANITHHIRPTSLEQLQTDLERSERCMPPLLGTKDLGLDLR